MDKLRVEAGRCIVRESDDEVLYTLHRVGSDSVGYAASPTEADRFVHTAVDVINVHDDLVEALGDLLDVQRSEFVRWDRRVISAEAGALAILAKISDGRVRTVEEWTTDIYAEERAAKAKGKV